MSGLGFSNSDHEEKRSETRFPLEFCELGPISAVSMHKTITGQLTAGFALILSLLIIGAVGNMVLTSRALRDARLLADQASLLSERGAALEQQLVRARVHFIYFGSAGHMERLEPGKQELAGYEQKLVEIGAMALDARFGDVAGEVRKLREALVPYRRVLEDMQQPGGRDPERMREWAGYGDILTKGTQKISGAAAVATHTMAKHVETQLATSRAITTGGVLLSTVLAGVLAFFIRRSVKTKLGEISSALTESANECNAVSRQAADASQMVARDASSQAASIEETAAALEELAGTARQNNLHAKEILAAVTEALESAKRGGTKTRELHEHIVILGKTNADVVKITRTIDEIAFQTNLLALNAAVEAARAGEAGAGFAVVADEVRALAQRAAAAAKESNERIGASLAETQSCVTISEALGQAFVELDQRMEISNTQANSIAATSAEQQRGVEEISKSIQQVDRITQGNAAAAEETASASEQLQQQVRLLNDNIARLKAISGLENESAPPEATPKPEKAALQRPKLAGRQTRVVEPVSR